MTEAQMWGTVWRLWVFIGALPSAIWIAAMIAFDLDFNWLTFLLVVGWAVVWFFVILRAARENKASHDKLKEDQ